MEFSLVLVCESMQIFLYARLQAAEGICKGGKLF
jgi:hypothetical protein